MSTTGTAPYRRRSLIAGAAAWPLAIAAPEKLPDLTGRSITVRVVCLGPCRASAIAAEMGASFAAFVRAERGYEARLVFADETALPETGWPADRHVILAPPPLLAGLAARKWIIPLSPLIRARPALEVAWYAPVVREAFQLFPESSNNCWAIPQSGDTLVLFVRFDLLASEAERAAFRAATGGELPRRFEDFAGLSWSAFRRLLEFFHRPERGLAGWIAPSPADPDGFAASWLSYLLGAGGRLWNAEAGRVEGVLNTAANSAAIAAYLGLLAYQPAGAARWSAAQAMDHFVAGGAFAALQWASAGPSLLRAGMAEKVMVVPAPGFAGPEGTVARRSVVGGRLWAVNGACDAEHLLAAADLLDWWCRPETMEEFAGRGGLPVAAATLSSPAFDGGRPWHRAYKVMLRDGADLWRDPSYGALLAVQQEMLVAVLAGSPAASALQTAACRQQAILFDEGSANERPSSACRER